MYVSLSVLFRSGGQVPFLVPPRHIPFSKPRHRNATGVGQAASSTLPILDKLLNFCNTCPLNVKWKFSSQKSSLLSKECQHFKTFWKYTMPNECLLLVWLIPMCRFILLLKNRCCFTFILPVKHVLQRRIPPWHFDLPSKNSLDSPFFGLQR